MHVLFVIDPLPSLQAYKDSSVAMMRALAARGHTLSVALQGDLFIDQGIIRALSLAIGLVPDADLDGHEWWRALDARGVAVSEVDAVVMRKEPPVDICYLDSTHLLELAEQQGAKVFNSCAA